MNPFKSINKTTNFIYKLLKIIVMLFFIIITWSKVQNVFALENEKYIYYSYDGTNFKEDLERIQSCYDYIDENLIPVLKEKNIDYIISVERYYNRGYYYNILLDIFKPNSGFDSYFVSSSYQTSSDGLYLINRIQTLSNNSIKLSPIYRSSSGTSGTPSNTIIPFVDRMVEWINNDYENFNNWKDNTWLGLGQTNNPYEWPYDVFGGNSYVFIYDSNLPIYYKQKIYDRETFIPEVKFYKDETLLEIKEGDQYPTYKSFNSSPGGDEEHEYILKASEHKYMVLDIDLSSSKELDFTFDLTSDRNFEIPYYKVFTENSSKIQFPNEVDSNMLKNKYTGELKGTYNTSTNKIQFIVSMNNIPTDQEITFKFKCNQEFNISYIDTSGYVDITLQKDYAVLLIPKNVNLDTGFQTDVYSPIYFNGGMTFKVQSNYNEAPTEVVFGKKYQVKEMSVVNYISKYSDKPYLYIFNENYTTQGILNLKIDTTYYNYTIFSSPYDSVDVTNPNTGGNKVETLPSTNVPSDDESFNLSNIMNDIMEYLSKATEPVRWFTMIWESLGVFQPLIYLPFLFFMILLLVNLLRR